MKNLEILKKKEEEDEKLHTHTQQTTHTDENK